MSHIILTTETGIELTTRKRLLEKYPTVGFGNLQALLENDALTVIHEYNKHYYDKTQVEPIIEAWIIKRDAKKNKHV